MLLLPTTSAKLRLVTSSTATMHVHASYVDLSGTTVTPGIQNTIISTATTTDIVASPGTGGTTRNVKTLCIVNAHASLSGAVDVIHTDGTTACEIYSIVLGPGAVVHYNDEAGFFSQSRIEYPPSAWSTKVICVGDITEPARNVFDMQRAGNVAATPTNIGTTVARCMLFVPESDITVNRIRWYGVGATTSVYRVAIYRYSDLARLTSELAITTVANAWGSVDASALALTGGVVYFAAVAVNATGTTAGMAAIGGTVAATTGQIQTAPASLPGNLDPAQGYLHNYAFQFAVTAGALPNPAATLAAQAAWTGGFPALFLDNSTAV